MVGTGRLTQFHRRVTGARPKATAHARTRAVGAGRAAQRSPQSDASARREDAAVQAYNWARLASDPKDEERAEAVRIINSNPETATEWHRWVAKVPQRVTLQQAADLALMWARGAAVQESR